MAMNLIRGLLGRCLILGAIMTAAPATASGDLLVAPTRVVLNGGGSAEIVLSNIGNEAATYRIGLELRRMGPEGDFAEVSEAEANQAERTAMDMLRYAPKRITLLPGQPQAIRLSARPGPDVPDGEYRVHMSFRAIPPALSAEALQAQATSGQLAIELTPIYGITIPIFIRKGLLEGAAALANPRLRSEADRTWLELDLTRTGNRSVYGDIIGKRDGADLFLAKGIAIYPEVGARTVRIPLTADQALRARGTLQIEYREPVESGGKLIAATTTTVR